MPAGQRVRVARLHHEDDEERDQREAAERQRIRQLGEWRETARVAIPDDSTGGYGAGMEARRSSRPCASGSAVCAATPVSPQAPS